MPNPLFNALSGGMGHMMPPQFQRMVQQFNQFRSTFQGDPEAQVRQLMKDGRMSQDQFNTLAQMANTFKSFMG